MLHLIPNMKDIRKILRLAERYDAAFEYNEFAQPAVLRDEEKTREIISFYKSLDRDRSRDTLHGAFLDITIHSEDPDIRRISKERVYRCMNIADSLGIKGVIFHTNTIPNFRSQPYLENWLKLNEDFYRKVTEAFPHISIYMENMFDEVPDELASLAEQMKEVANFGICFDYAHANIFGRRLPLKTWAQLFMPYTRHIHINDNDGLIDMHAAVGAGSINWSEYNELVGGYVREQCMSTDKNAPSVLIETSGIENFEKSCKYMSEHGIYPFR